MGHRQSEDRELWEELLRRVKERDTPALRKAWRSCLGQLVRALRRPASQRSFDEGDFKIYLLNWHLEETK